MNHKAAIEAAAVAASGPVTWVTAGAQQTIVSMAVGLIGVWLARIVFVNRENRRLGHEQSMHDTLPTTLAACLIAGVVIYDGRLGISAAAFLGLGVGWTTVLLLEFFGDNILNAMRALSGRTASPPHPPPPYNGEVYPNVPDDMNRTLNEIDDKTPDYKPPHR